MVGVYRPSRYTLLSKPWISYEREEWIKTRSDLVGWSCSSGVESLGQVLCVVYALIRNVARSDLTSTFLGIFLPNEDTHTAAELRGLRDDTKPLRKYVEFGLWTFTKASGAWEVTGHCFFLSL